MKVKAIATRCGEWWAIEVPDIDGGVHTQARRLDQMEDMVHDALALFGLDDVDVDIVPVVAVEDQRAITAAREASAAAADAANAAGGLTRAAVARLRSEGLTVRDIGALMGISPQRVSQLAYADRS